MEKNYTKKKQKVKQELEFRDCTRLPESFDLSETEVISFIIELLHGQANFHQNQSSLKLLERRIETFGSCCDIDIPTVAIGD